MNGLGAIQVNREGGRAALLGLRRRPCRRSRSGDLVGVYPEGTRSPDGRLYRGRTGVARLALAARRTGDPGRQIGTDKIQPIGQGCPAVGPAR